MKGPSYTNSRAAAIPKQDPAALWESRMLPVPWRSGVGGEHARKIELRAQQVAAICTRIAI